MYTIYLNVLQYEKYILCKYCPKYILIEFSSLKFKIIINRRLVK